jgi:hypothetical protein
MTNASIALGGVLAIPTLIKVTPVDPVTGRPIGKTRIIWPLPKRPTHAADRTVSKRKAAGRRRTKHRIKGSTMSGRKVFYG